MQRVYNVLLGCDGCRTKEAEVNCLVDNHNKWEKETEKARNSVVAVVGMERIRLRRIDALHKSQAQLRAQIVHMSRLVEQLHHEEDMIVNRGVINTQPAIDGTARTVVLQRSFTSGTFDGWEVVHKWNQATGMFVPYWIDPTHELRFRTYDDAKKIVESLAGGAADITDANNHEGNVGQAMTPGWIFLPYDAAD
jgi:hypothetical protein